jgi:hypothetical protein
MNRILSYKFLTTFKHYDTQYNMFQVIQIFNFLISFKRPTVGLILRADRQYAGTRRLSAPDLPSTHPIFIPYLTWRWQMLEGNHIQYAKQI